MPVSARHVDGVFEGREGELRMFWRDRALGLGIHDSPNLPFTPIYKPKGKKWF